MDPTVGSYIAYLTISTAFTCGVGYSLSRNGRVFLAEVFGGNQRLTDAVNRLLVVGFFLVNFGFVTLYLRVGGDVANLREAFESLSVKVGTVLLVLGVLHLGNVVVFNRLRTTAGPPLGGGYEAWTGRAQR